MERNLSQSLTHADVQRMGDADLAALVDWLERLGLTPTLANTPVFMMTSRCNHDPSQS